MDKRLRLNAEGTIGFFAVSVIIFWMWRFFRSYFLFVAILLMIAGGIISAVCLWAVQEKIQAEIVLPSHRMGKNADVPFDIRLTNPLRLAGFAIDVTYRCENLFTGSVEKKREKLWASPGKGEKFHCLLSSRHAGRLKVSVEECRVYDFLHIFYLAYREMGDAEILACPAFSDGEGEVEPCSYIEGFPGKNESRKRGVEFNPDYEIREYSAGDELKNIHWKLSAKQGEMMVRERLSAGREKINVLLPLGDNLDENDALVESLYSMCRLLLFREYPIQLFWQGVNEELCSRYIVESGELENALGEILSTDGRHVPGSAEEQMAAEHPSESCILVKTGVFRGVYISCQQESRRLDF